MEEKSLARVMQERNDAWKANSELGIAYVELAAKYDELQSKLDKERRKSVSLRNATCRLRARLYGRTILEARRLVVAFVQGARWWEFESTGATMWGSDQAKAYDEAERRLHNDTLGKDTSERGAGGKET